MRPSRSYASCAAYFTTRVGSGAQWATLDDLKCCLRRLAVLYVVLQHLSLYAPAAAGCEHNTQFTHSRRLCVAPLALEWHMWGMKLLFECLSVPTSVCAHRSGTGGGISMRAAGDRIVMAPSGVQKERMEESDMFVLDGAGNVVHTPQERPPPARPPKLSECAPLFTAVRVLRSCMPPPRLHPLCCCCCSSTTCTSHLPRCRSV